MVTETTNYLLHCIEEAKNKDWADGIRFALSQALKQESVLDKIIAEIKELDTYYVNDFYIGNMDAMLKRDYVLQILDKYKTEDENP